MRGMENREAYALQQHSAWQMSRGLEGLANRLRGSTKPCGFRVEGVGMPSSEKLKALHGLYLNDGDVEGTCSPDR